MTICTDIECLAYSAGIKHRSHTGESPDDLCKCGHFKREHEWKFNWPGGVDKFPGLNVPDEYVSTCKICKCEKYQFEVALYISDITDVIVGPG